MVPPLRHCRKLPAIAAIFALGHVLAAAPRADAADGAWLFGQTGTLDWQDGQNWIAGEVPGANTGSDNADTATFGSNADATFVTIDAGRNLQSLLFNGTNPLGLYTIGSAGANGGEALRLSSGGSITVAAGALTETTIHAPLVLEAASPTSNGSYTIANNSTTAGGAFANDNLYKLFVLGDLSGGVTTGSITLTLAGTSGSRGVNASANIVSGLISDGGAAGGLALNVTGASGGNIGAWQLDNDDNSYTGPTTITGGTLQFTSIGDAGVNSALGAGSLLQLNAGSHAKYLGGNASSNRSIVSNAGSLYAVGSGTLTLTGTVTLNGGMTLRGGRNFVFDTVIGGTGDLNRTDNGTAFLNQINTFTGNIGISDGAFRFGSIANKGIASPIGAGSTIRLGQNSGTVGRIEFTGAAGGSSDRDILLSNGNGASSGNGRIDNTVAGQVLALSGWVRSTSGTASHLSNLNLTGIGDGILSGVVGGTTGSATTPNNMSLVKNGTGTWGLSNANLYYGATTISAGTLLALNTGGSATGTGNVTTSGSGTLGGTGIVTAAGGGSITIASGTTLRVGTTHGIPAGSAGPLGTVAGASNLHLGTAADVAITLAGTLQFDLFGGSGGATAGSADRLFLATTAASVTLGGTVAVSDQSGAHAPWRAGTWQLIDWSGIGAASTTGDFTYQLPTASLASGYSFVTDDFLTTGSISIEKTAANHTWTGATDASWTEATNWEAGTVPTSGTDVFFTSADNLTHSLNGDRNVRNLFFSGDANHVINTGTSGVLYSHGGYLEVLGGSQRLNTAQLRIANGNIGTYRIVNEGTLSFGREIMYHRLSGSGNLVIEFSGAGDTTVNHFLRRTNAYDVDLVFVGPGTVTFTGFSSTPASSAQGTITGTTIITGGKVRLNNELNLGSGPDTFNPGHLTLDGGTLAAADSFSIADANRGITLGSAGGTIEVESSFTLDLEIPVTGPGSLEKTGPGILVLSASNDYGGATTVTAGTLRINGDQSAANGVVNVQSGATLGGGGTVGGSTTVLSGGTLTAGADGSIGTLTFQQPLAFESGSVWLVDLVLGAADASDLLVVTPTDGLSLSGALEVNPIGGTFAFGTAYRIAQYNGVLGGLGAFSNDVDGLIYSGGHLWEVNYHSGGYITLTAVPEPGTLGLLGLGLGGLLARRFRRRREAAEAAEDAE